MRVINFYGGPGSGKSTVAAGLFYLMKSKGYNVELVQEYVKDLAWENRMEDQAFIAAHQNKKLHRLQGKVDYVICDSSLIIGLVYLPKDYPIKSFKDYMIELFQSYDNFLHVYVNRSVLHNSYDTNGRFENEEQAKIKDMEILDLMSELGLEFSWFDLSPETPSKILKLIEGKNDSVKPG